MGEKEKWDGDTVHACVPKKRTTIYVSPSVDVDFRKICDREGVSVSKKLQEFMEEYNQGHKRGNPQLLISHYVKATEPQPLRVLCLYCQGALSDGRIFCQKRGQAWIPSLQCYSCKHNRMRKVEVKRP